jgi:iron-sulfur cluster assembly protein
MELQLMNIRLTPPALERVKSFLAREPLAAGFRFGVQKTGCSGWGYRVDIAHEVQADDAVMEQDGVRIVVDAGSLALVDGTEIDFIRQGLNQQFTFRNPRATGECGCGESFTVSD